MDKRNQKRKKRQAVKMEQKRLKSMSYTFEREKDIVRYVIVKQEQKELEAFWEYLEKVGCAYNTMLKYQRDVKSLLTYMRKRREMILTEKVIIGYRDNLIGSYAPTSINSMLAAVEKFLAFHGIQNYRIPKIKIQKRIFCDEKKELREREYKKLLETARADARRGLGLIIETIGMTGIRISELKYFTVRGVLRRKIQILNKGKLREILIPEHLRKRLLYYAAKKGIKKGMIFVTRTGKAMDRSNIWKQMKRLGKKAEILRNKIYPHNLRHLFARTFYTVTKDIMKLADVLGHSNVSTTRIYLLGTGQEHRKELRKVEMRLLGLGQLE